MQDAAKEKKMMKMLAQLALGAATGGASAGVAAAGNLGASGGIDANGIINAIGKFLG